MKNVYITEKQLISLLEKTQMLNKPKLRKIIYEALSESFHLPSYSEWKQNVEEELMWFQYKGGRARWKIGENVFFDKSGHALGHLGPSLLKNTLMRVNLNSNRNDGIIEDTVSFERPIGYQECVETSDKDDIVYLQRNGRKMQSRFAIGREPEPCNTVFIVLRKINNAQNVYQILTAYVGRKSGKEPWDRTAVQSDVDFWKTHALVSPNSISRDDDVGDEGYWTRMVSESFKISENNLQKIISEAILKEISENLLYSNVDTKG